MDDISIKTELRNRARWAYRALEDAEKARSELADLDLDGHAEQIAVEAAQCESAYKEAHVRMTGREPFTDDVRFAPNGVVPEDLAARHAPTHPTDVGVARENAIEFRNAGNTVMRLAEMAIDAHHIESDSGNYREIKTAAMNLIGNGEFLRAVLSEDFERHAETIVEESA